MIHRIDIPSRNLAREAAVLVVAELRRLGVHPLRMAYNPLGIELCKQWAQGRMTDAKFRRSVRNLLTLNPTLAG